MGEMKKITAEVDEAMLSALDAVLATKGQTRESFLVDLLRSYLDRDAELVALAQKGIDDIEAGRFLTHEQLVERLRARRANRKVA